MKRYLLGAVSILVLAGTYGAGLSVHTTNVTTTAKPVPAVTVTAKPAPAPTVTKSVTVTKEKPVTPTSCLTAINTARKVFGETSKTMTLAAQYPKLIQRAAIAGTTMDTAEIRRITKILDRGNATLTQVNAHMDGLPEMFNTAAADCDRRK